MYDEHGEPSETLINDWNEHNDHAGDRDEDDAYDNNDREITALRKDLADAMDDAAKAVADAVSHVGRLSGNEVFDVEYAESTIGADIADFLASARRALVAARALNRQVPG